MATLSYSATINQPVEKVFNYVVAVETAYLFEAAGNATKLTISMDVPAGAYPAAAEAMIKQQMQKSLEEQGNRIKQMVEKLIWIFSCGRAGSSRQI